VPNQRNPEISGVVIGLVIIAAGAALIIVPGLVGADMMRVGYGLGLIGVFLVVAGAVTGVFYWVRSATLQRILAGQNLLVHWRYEPGQWQRYAEAEFERNKADKRSLFWLIAVIMAVVGTVFYIGDPEGGFWVVVVLTGLLALLAILAFVVPRLDYNRNRQSVGEALISPEGVYLNGRFHIWNRLGSRLTSVSLVEGDPAAIEFEIAYPSRTGTQVYTVRVPIPRGQEEVAQQVIAHLDK
jgi:hypothetical protein